jgi:hypothetical protein
VTTHTISKKHNNPFISEKGSINRDTFIKSLKNDTIEEEKNIMISGIKS